MIKKGYIVAGLLFTAGVLPVSAQLQEQRRNFALGVNGGVNLSSVSFQPTIKQNTMIGPAMGITARYISEKYFKMICGVQMEVNYSQRGWNEKIEDGTDNTYKRSMSYIEIPLLAHLAFGKDEGHGARFIVNLGPQVGFLLSEKETMGGNWAPDDRYTSNITYGKMADNKFDYGLVGGMGVELRTGIGNFVLEGRYYFGLSDFYGNSKSDPYSRSAHSYIGGRLTYLFDISR